MIACGRGPGSGRVYTMLWGESAQRANEHRGMMSMEGLTTTVDNTPRTLIFKIFRSLV